MSVDYLDLSPIKGLSPGGKAKMPVSITRQADNTLLVVSRYGDDVWDFYPFIPQENLCPAAKIIDWRYQLPDGRRLTDPEHADLLNSAKEFIWSLFVHPVEGRKRPTLQTIKSKFHALCPLLSWMVKVGIRKFVGLTGRTIDYAQVASRKEDGSRAADQTIVPRLLVVEDLFNQRDKINDALLVHPWPQETACSLVGFARRANFKPTTEVIPDTVAYRLASVALDYVRNRAQSMLVAMESVNAAGEEIASAGRAKQAIVDARTLTARSVGYAGAAELTTDLKRLRTACYIVIDMFSGIRDSEMMSIAEHCIAHGRSRDGSMDVVWLHGTIYKTGVRPKRWLVPPVVEEAVRVLTRLTASLRHLLRLEERELEALIALPGVSGERPIEIGRLTKRLHFVRKHKDKLFLTRPMKQGVGVMSGGGMRSELKRFCIDHSILDGDGRPYNLHAHQFRRTYARFIARSELGDLLTLRDHFGHWSIDMTVYYADGGADGYETDTELMEMIAEEKIGRQNEIMAGYLNSDAPLANGGHWLKGWRATVRTAANKEALIAEYAGSIILNGTGHSWCVGNAKGTGCGGLCVFEAQMCVDCNYGIIGPEHRPVWEGISEQQKEALTLNDMGPGGRARAQEILAYAKKVLRRLDGLESV